VQDAPVVGGVVIAIDCDVPLITVAHPDKAKPSAAAAASGYIFMEYPIPLDR
jgi:hypothetical protein